MNHEDFISRVRSNIKTPTKEIEEDLDAFCAAASYVSGQYDCDESFIELNKHMEKLEEGHAKQHRIFYMALPPKVFVPVSQHIKRTCYPRDSVARIIVRKAQFHCLGIDF